MFLVFGEEKSLPKPLSEKELFDLFVALKNGDQTAKDKIIYHNIRLVYFRITTRFDTIEYDKDELATIGIIGLIKAINSFDITKNIKFSTYAVRCIDNEILMFLRKLKKEQSRCLFSLDETAYITEKGYPKKVEDFFRDDTDLEEEFIEKERLEVLRNIIENLPEREKGIIIMYFGYNGSPKYKQTEIAQKYGVTQAGLSRIIKRILEKIANQLKQYESGSFDIISPESDEDGKHR